MKKTHERLLPTRLLLLKPCLPLVAKMLRLRLLLPVRVLMTCRTFL